MLMGGGGSFSAGGPGKGMHSRLCKFYLCLLVYNLVWSMMCFILAIYFILLLTFLFEKSLFTFCLMPTSVSLVLVLIIIYLL